MAIWISGEEVTRLHGELLDAKRLGNTLVVYEKEQDAYGVDDFIAVKDDAQAQGVLAMFSSGKVSEIELLVAQLDVALNRGFAEWAVLPDFEPMGLEEGSIFSDLKLMGLKEPELEAMIYDRMEEKWAEIALHRKVGEINVGLRLYRVDINGKARIPEFAIVFPKVLESVPDIKTGTGDSRTLESEIKRTVTYEMHQTMVHGENPLGVVGAAAKAILFMGLDDSDKDFSLRCQVVATLLHRYPQGQEIGEMLLAMRPEYFRHMYHMVPFPYTVKANQMVKKISSPSEMLEISHRAYLNKNLKKAIMEAKNLENLKAEMVKLGFSENLIGQMEARMAANEPRFILYDELQGEKGRVEMALHFNQSRTSEYYYFNKFDLVKETQPPLAPGEKYFVSSQRQGEDVVLKEFEMPSLAVKEFNARMEASKDIRGAAQIYAGKSLEDSRELATMSDGKIIDVQTDFYKTLKNPAPGQTFYIEKGNGFTLSQGLNLLAGRSVFREDILDINKHEYSAWAKLDFDAPRDRGGNFHQKNFTEGYGFDLPAVLDRFDFRELGSADKRAELEAALMNGDRAVVTVDMAGKKEAILVEAVPEFKQVNLYSLEGKSIKREEHLKEEKIAEVGVGKERSMKKGKEQQEGLSV